MDADLVGEDMFPFFPLFLFLDLDGVCGLDFLPTLSFSLLSISSNFLSPFNMLLIIAKES